MFKNKINSFDCIVGNPPFQDYYGLTNKGKRINGGKNKLYERIFLKCYNLLNEKGFISFVVPDNIFSGNGSECYKTIIKNNIPFVSFSPTNKNYFKKIQQPVCYFILQKGKEPTKTKIEYNDNLYFHTKLKDRPVNPIRNWTQNTEKLIEKYVSSIRNDVVYNRGKSINSYKGNKYNVVYSLNKTLKTNNIKLSPGIGIKKAIIFSISPKLEFKMDYSGNLGVGPNTFFVPFKTNVEGKKIESFLKSSDYKLLANATKTTRQYLKIAFIEHLNFSIILNKTQRCRIHTNKTRKFK
jgi:hypothetical protein